MFEEIHGNKKRFLAFFMAILGLSLSSNIIYLFTIGSTYITIAEVFSVLLFMYLLVTKHINWRHIFAVTGIEFQLFSVMIVISGVFALITFMDLVLMYRYLVGVISLAISCITLIDIISLFEYRLYFIKGCAIGIVINAIICVIQYIFYQRNIPFNFLYNLFPQEWFHLNIYNFCAQGLFLEPSNMNQFLGSITTVFIGMMGLKGLGDKFIFVLVLVCCALSTSGTAAVVLVGLILYFLIKRPLGRYVRRSGFMLFYFVVLSFLLVYIFCSDSSIVNMIIKNVSGYIKLASEGSNITDSSNLERVQSMRTAIGLIPQNLLGCGWNMVHTLLQQKTGLGTASAFSDILEMVLEIGILGVAFYFASAIKSIVACLRAKDSESIGVAVAIISILIMETLVDYAINPCIMSILALGMCFRYKHLNAGRTTNVNGVSYHEYRYHDI